ncbi:MAG TPA: carbohydrate-binding protein, partial [Mucilaginibacter sp.]|nr:carbohydrate-binding protein [Mucilaginibacter sp.]
DIQADDNGYHVFSIEDGEWLQYTIQAAKGTYTVKLLISSDGGKGKVSLMVGDKPVQAAISLADASSAGWRAVEIKNVQLNKGVNHLKVLADEGGFNFKSIQFIKN